LGENVLALKTYYVRKEHGRLRISTKNQDGDTNCDDVFAKFGELLKKLKFELVMISNTDHREEAYKKGDFVVVLMPDYCVIKTNLPFDKFDKLIKALIFERDISGII